jgi:hypothetical protein
MIFVCFLRIDRLFWILQDKEPREAFSCAILSLLRRKRERKTHEKGLLYKNEWDSVISLVFISFLEILTICLQNRLKQAILWIQVEEVLKQDMKPFMED